MQVRTKFFLIDQLFNYFLFTPLVILFWFGTYSCFDTLVFDRVSSRLQGAVILFSFGLAVEFTFAYWQDAIAAVIRGGGGAAGGQGGTQGRQAGLGLIGLLYTRAYNYTLAVANIAHYRGIQELYDLYLGPGAAGSEGLAPEDGGLRTAVQTAATAMLVLWGLRAGRNLTAIPFCVSLDTDTEGWFDTCTLFQSQKSRGVTHLADTLVTVAVVWTLGPLHWITLGYVFDLTVFPDNATDSMVASVVLGYGAVAACTALQGRVRALSHRLHSQNRHLVKVLVEDAYIYVATAAVILSWKGVGMAVDSLARQFPLTFGGQDHTGLCAQLGAFLLLSACYASASLVGKGAEWDGGQPGGAGVEFSVDYFGHFFGDFITERERGEKLKAQ